MFALVLEDDHHVLTLSGQINIQNSQQLKSLFSDLDASRDLVIDASELEYIDSSGVACMIIAYKKLMAAGKALKLRNPSESLMTVLKILKFESLFQIEG
ncbi:MAG: STAS domain-containing protein [Alphaproteobacteria bacterium]|nr:STAS domain-containing protein [Alphaproteobacteria bacterium]